MPINFVSGDGYGKLTQTAGTRLRLRVGGEGPGFSHVLGFVYADTGTAHTITLMRGVSRDKSAGAQAAASTTLVTFNKLLDGDGNDIAASDILCVQLDNGSWHDTTVSSLSTDKLTITLTDAIPTGRSVLDGAKVVLYGVAGDAFHQRRQFASGAASGEVLFGRSGAGQNSLCKATQAREPIIIDSNNATNAGTIVHANAGYTLV